MSIRIITINTWKGDGDYLKRITVLARQLKELKADIIACQECFHVHGTNINTLGFLSKELNMNSQYTDARRKERQFSNALVDSSSGLGVLSVYPLSFEKEIIFPYSEKDGERKAQIVSVKSPDTNLLVCNVHLTHLRDHCLRKEQAQIVAERIRDFTAFTQKIICGDFNTTIESEEMRVFKEQLNAADAFELFRGTYPRQREEYKNNFQLVKEVDHILTIPHQGKHMLVKNAQMVLNKPDNELGIYASDHPGVMIDIDL